MVAMIENVLARTKVKKKGKYPVRNQREHVPATQAIAWPHVVRAELPCRLTD